MGGAIKSAGNFLGLGSGPQAPEGQFGNQALSQLNGQNSFYSSPQGLEGLNNYANGSATSSDVLNNPNLTPAQQAENMNALATNPITGTKYATEQVQNNGILGSLFGQGGELNKQEGVLDNLQNQGFQLKPEDQTAYGQASGNIARMFGQQGNQAASNLASRGLSSSGAAGQMFSGLAGSQNEMLAQAQQSIMQQRVQNTMQQIGQQQSFINSLGQQAGNDINQQYGRQSQGAGMEKSGLESGASLQGSQNNAQNQYGLQAAGFNAANAPKNFMDFGTAGLGQGLQSGASSMFSGQPQQPAMPTKTTSNTYSGMGPGNSANLT